MQVKGEKERRRAENGVTNARDNDTIGLPPTAVSITQAARNTDKITRRTASSTLSIFARKSKRGMCERNRERKIEKDQGYITHRFILEILVAIHRPSDLSHARDNENDVCTLRK